jgi:death on curing protein
VIYLDLEDLLHVADRVLGGEVGVRDAGLLESAAARPQATVFGADAYSSLHDKAAALLQSVVGNHALVDGNKRLGLGSLIAFLGVNGWRLTLTNDEAYALVMAVASGELQDVAAIAAILTEGSTPVAGR